MPATPTRHDPAPSTSASPRAAASAPAPPSAPAVAALAAAGVLFAAYPAIRPYADETAIEGAAAMASEAWVIAHTAGTAAFALVAIGLGRLLAARPGRRAAAARTALWAGVLLVLPFYGAETFGLHAIGAQAAAAGDVDLLVEATAALRYDPYAITPFAAGLLALIPAGALTAVELSGAAPLQRIGAVLAGAGLALYLPQFFTPGPVRIAHGVALGVGCLLLAAGARPRAGTATGRR